MNIPSLRPAGLPLLWAALSAILPWSPVSAADSVVVFNEINYHPKADTGTEWVELRNLMGVNVDLSGWRLSGGVEFTFASGTVIPGHGFLLVAADPAHVSLTGKGALGPFSGSLENAGETLRLRNNSERVMDELSYSDGGDWPVGADGSGATLTKRLQESADPRPANWTASPEPGGTPAALNFPLAGQPPVTTSLMALTETWKYRADPAAPPAAWNSTSFDDSSWSSGPAALYAGNAEVSGAGEGLIAWWPLNETSGTTAANSAAGGPAGLLVNGPTWVNDPTRGRVISLAGATDYVSAGSALIPPMTLTNPFTWSFWANSSQSGTSSVVLGNRTSPTGAEWSPREFIKFTPAAFEFHRNGSGEDINYPDFPSGGWVHHAVVKAGAVLTYYRNGTASGTVTISQGTAHPQPLYLGGDQASENWSGLMDDVALWTKALPASSIAGLAAGLVTPLTAPTDANGGGALVTQIAGGTNTHYFRRSFIFSGNPALTTLSLQHRSDDGAVFYLNGTEVTRFNMPGGTVSHATPASSEITNATLSPVMTIPGSALQAGLNVLAVEIHQITPSSPDMVFAASLEALQAAPAPDEILSPVVFNEISSVLDAVFRVELTNISASAVNLAGWVLRSSSGASFTLPAQSLAPGGFLVLDSGTLGFTPPDGDRLFLYSSGGGILSDARAVTRRLRGRYGEQWIYPSAPTFGAANSFVLNTAVVINEIMYNPRALDAVPEIPAAVQTTTLLDWNATWRFQQNGTNLGDTWETTVHPVGGAWQSGTGPIGYETSVGVPAHPIVTTLPPPLGNNPYVMTYYFETDFNLTAQQIAALTELRITHEVDDGAIFFLNGQDIGRYAMPDEPVTAGTPSNGSGEAVTTGPVTLAGAAALLVPGVNRLSVEVHQVNTTSSDVVFGLKLEGVGILTPAVPGLPFRNSDEQWIELHNRSAVPVDLAGWELTDGVEFVFPANTLLAPGGFLILARDAVSMAAKHPAIQIAGPFSGSLSRSGERLRLTDAVGNPADEVRYADGGRWPGKADGEGSSMELRDPRADRRTPEAWAASDESARRVWRTHTYSVPATNGQNDPVLYNEFILGLLDAGEILLDDLSVIESPAGTARQLIQNGSFSGGSADFWRFLGTHRHIAVIDDPDSPGNKVLHLRASGASEHMHNHGETTLKSGGSFVTINSSLTYQISFRAKWLSGSNKLNTRLYFNRAARTTLLEAQADGGTPGTVNSTRIPNAGPDLNGLAHSPAVPAAGTSATVSVTAADPDGIAGLTLFYAVNGGAFSSVPMVGLGEGGYSGTVPAQGAGAKVQFYVSAQDGAGAGALLPAGGMASRAMIPWADGQANPDYGTVRPNNFRIVMLQTEADFMHTNTQVMSNDRLGCTVIYNEREIYYDCGVRLKGSERGRPKDVRVGFTVGFPADQPFLGAHGTVSVDRSGAGDQFSQKEILVKHAAARAGRIPGMNDDLIRVIAPKSTHTGSAILLKSRFDDEWLDNQFEDGGEGRMFEYN